MLWAGSCTPVGTNWSFGVQDATLIFFQVLPVLGCNIKLQEVTASRIFFFPSHLLLKILVHQELSSTFG